MSSVSVANRINIGYAILTCAILCLAGGAYLAISKLGNSYQSYRATAQQTLLINSVVEDIFDARIAALKHRSNPVESVVADVNANLEAAQLNIDILLKTQTSADLASQIRTVVDQASTYQQSFAETVQIRTQIERRGQELEAQHAAIVLSVTALGNMNRPGQSFSDILAESTVRTALFTNLRLGTEAAARFVANGDVTQAEASQTAFDDARLGLLELGPSEGSAPEDPLVVEITEHLEDGLGAIDTMEQTIADVQRDWFAVNQIDQGTLDVVGPAMMENLEAAVSAIVASQETLGMAGQGVVDTTLRMTPVVGIFAFVLAVSIAFLIGRWITVPVAQLARTTQDLAGGNTAVNIVGREHNHELGQMAQSLEVFREAIKKDQAAAERSAQESAEQQLVVSRLSDGLRALADGQLDQRLNEAFQDAYEPLRHDFNFTLDRLEQTLRQVVVASQHVENGVGNINGASQDLSERTANQAATLEQSAAALDELTISIKSSATQTQEVDKTVQEARRDAQNSEDVVNHAVQAMGRIEHSSQQISKITDVISDISFQTNLLALNAGVEAARAGEAGRGFAVVASEVRALALRSSEAAQEVSDLIGKSSAEVTEGTKLVNKAGEALGQIVIAVDRVSQLIAEITSSAVEQATGLTEINTGINMLDDVTQKNASMVENSFIQGQQLVAEARQLEELVQQFRLSNVISEASAPKLASSA